MRTLRSHRYNRRRFLQSAAVASAAATMVLPSHIWAESPNEKVDLAGVGVGGKGWGDINAVSDGHNVVAFCDVDTKGTKRKGGYTKAADKWPNAKRYTDYRELLDKEHKRLDGITVSTPDHMHAPITMSAIYLGLATYTQKPMTRTVHEARQVRLMAKKAGTVTQMGNQNHSGPGYLTLVKWVQSGVIGKVKEAHAWSNRPIWPQGVDRPSTSAKVPENLNWDLWLGVAAKRPFAPDVYHPFAWRGWFDFGAGALGDMGCHIIDPVVWALELQAPTSVKYSGPTTNNETFPAEETIRYQFPGTKQTSADAVAVTWYDGNRLPPKDVVDLPDERKYKNGCCLVGEKGMIVCPHGQMPEMWPAKKFADVDLPKVEGANHYLQWTNAIRGESETTSHFDYAGPLTETVLLGTIACRFPDIELAWDTGDLRFTNYDKANEYVQVRYRKGWEVDGL